MNNTDPKETLEEIATGVARYAHPDTRDMVWSACIRALEDYATTQVEAERKRLLQELIIKAERDIATWQNSEDYDHTTNDGLYSFVQHLRRLLSVVTKEPLGAVNGKEHGTT